MKRRDFLSSLTGMGTILSAGLSVAFADNPTGALGTRRNVSTC